MAKLPTGQPLHVSDVIAQIRRDVPYAGTTGLVDFDANGSPAASD